MVHSKLFHITLHVVSTLGLVLAIVLVHVIMNDETNKIHEQNLQENIESHDHQEKQNTELHTGDISKQHFNITREVSELYNIITTMLNQSGGMEQRLNTERMHYNQTIEVAEILLEYIKSVNNTDTTTGVNSSS